MPRNMRKKLSETCDAFKFEDFQEMWKECEANTAFRAGLEGIRIKWRETIFAVAAAPMATTTITIDSEDSA